MTIRPPNTTWLTHFPQSFQANAKDRTLYLIFFHSFLPHPLQFTIINQWMHYSLNK